MKTFFVFLNWRTPIIFFFFFGEHLRLCPWFFASSIADLGLERGCPWPWICFVFLASSHCDLDSTSECYHNLSDRNKLRYVKRAFNPNFEKLRKILKKYVYQHEPIAILATHQVKKVQGKKFHIFLLESKFRPTCFKYIAQ